MNMEEVGMIFVVIIALLFCLSEVGKGRMENERKERMKHDN